MVGWRVLSSPYHICETTLHTSLSISPPHSDHDASGLHLALVQQSSSEASCLHQVKDAQLWRLIGPPIIVSAIFTKSHLAQTCYIKVFDFPYNPRCKPWPPGFPICSLSSLSSNSLRKSLCNSWKRGLIYAGKCWCRWKPSEISAWIPLSVKNVPSGKSWLAPIEVDY